jgi:hypothetical protein
MPIDKGNFIGKFKKVLVSPSILPIEAKEIKEDILELKNLHEENKLDTVRLVILILIRILSHRIPKEWIQLPQSAHTKIISSIPKEQILKLPKENYSYWKNLLFTPDFPLLSFLEQMRFKNIPDSICKILSYWIQFPDSLQLIFYQPSTHEMLKIQSTGKRFITLSFSHLLNGELLEEKRDALEFLLHDLAHAYKFFLEDNLPYEQTKFFQTLLNHMQKFESFCQMDPTFQEDFHYCLADMNSHPEHLRQYLRAKLVEHFARFPTIYNQDSINSVYTHFLQNS